eukprot:COSAG01_NODE_841_length_13175_cov_26.426124_17_plen_62_part_00
MSDRSPPRLIDAASDCKVVWGVWRLRGVRLRWRAGGARARAGGARAAYVMQIVLDLGERSS